MVKGTDSSQSKCQVIMKMKDSEPARALNKAGFQENPPTQPAGHMAQAARILSKQAMHQHH